MRKIFPFLLWTLICTALFCARSEAQTTPLLGDEWINFQQTYYKIPVNQNGIYRISGQDLLSGGLPAFTPGTQFRLYRLGTEVPIIVSTNGAFSATDFIEFWGMANDGAADAALYPSPNVQTNPNRSLFSDTAMYFLTWTATGTGLRMGNATTAIPGTPVATTARVRATVRKSYGNFFHPGVSQSGFYRLFSSKFEEGGEGFLHAMAGAGTPLNESLPTPEGQAGDIEFLTGVAGFSIGKTATQDPGPLHQLKITVGSLLVVDTIYGSQEYRRFSASLTGWNGAANTAVTYLPTSGGSGFSDYWGAAFLQMKYWRTLNYASQNYAEFEVEASSTAQLLSLQNISAARLYDLTNRQYYDADLSVPGQAQFYLSPSAASRKCVVVTTPAISGVPSLVRANFKDYSAGGDYVMISHPALESGSTLTAYKNYRASATGGSHTPLLAYAPDLYDQFAGGVPQHPLAIKNFLSRLQRSATVKPKQVVLIGKGVSYPRYRSGAPKAFVNSLVPTYGFPGSDALFTDSAAQPLSIGRISVINSSELAAYLNKVKSYEAALSRVPAVPTLETERWKKKVVHIAGSSNQDLQKQLLYNLSGANTIITDTPFGGDVLTIAKNTTNPVDPFTNSFMDSVMNEGMGLLTFHGHAFAGGFDYNINTPEVYVNRPKLPLFIALGCDVAEIFDTGARTISERYVLAPRGGSIAMLAADQLQFPEFHGPYLFNLYRKFSGPDYQQTMGQQVADGYLKMLQDSISNTPRGFVRANLEAMIFQGDPALNLFHPQKPDFHLTSQAVFTIPAQVTSALDSFQLKMVAYNLGKGFRDTGLTVRVTRTKPDGTTVLVQEYPLPELLHTDTLLLWVPFDNRLDLGINRFTITINPDNRIAEISTANNTVVYDLFISGNNLVPVYPYQYGIVNEVPTLKASTLNPFAPSADYLLEIDTTQLFNSPLLRQTTLNGRGGLLKWQPNIPFTDSTVYYWRTAYKPASGLTPAWTESSFLYLPNVGEGWNQSHAFQYMPDARNGLTYNTTSRFFAFNRLSRRIAVRCKVMYNDADVENNKVQVDEVDFQRSSCSQGNTTIQFMVIDSIDGSLWKNSAAFQSTYGNLPACNLINRDVWAFEFSLNDSASRNKARIFLQAIPTGKFVLAKSSIYNPRYNPTNAQSWQADAAVYGAGNTLYDYLKNTGFTDIDSFYNRRAFVFWFQKNTPSYTPFQQVGQTDTSTIVQEFNVFPPDTMGRMTSVVVGPSLEWKDLHWKSKVVPYAAASADMDTLRVYGVGGAANGADTLLITTTARDTSLSGIPAQQFPNLRLQWFTMDTLFRQARQLQYWRVHFTLVPELALNPSAFFSLKDSSVIVGQPITMKVALENVSNTPMDSVLVRYRVVRPDGSMALLQDNRYRPLPAGDTLQAALSFQSIPYRDSSFIFIEANPDNDQPELYHPNNLGYVPFYVQGDVLNPLLDVTFDSIHISDRDIVSTHPEIRIRLIGQNRYRLLNDTSLMQVYLKSPDDPLTLPNGQRIPYDSTICRFFPAQFDSTGRLRNEAYVIYKPRLTKFSTGPDDNLYELIVQAQDPSGNASGSNDYRVSFRAVATSGITQIYNYPNPFVTGTRFAFLITGDALPKEIRIYIVDLKGRVVRTITEAQMGALRVGQNYPLYEWDGRDDSGAPLTPGIYLYRAEAKDANGANLPHISTDVDGNFKNGWGRMLFLPR